MPSLISRSISCASIAIGVTLFRSHEARKPGFVGGGQFADRYRTRLAEFQFAPPRRDDPRREDAEPALLLANGFPFVALWIDRQRQQIAALILAEPDRNRIGPGKTGDGRA